MVNHIWEIARNKGSPCTLAQVTFGERDHFDIVTGCFGKLSRHGLLIGQTLWLLFGCPEPDIIGKGCVHPNRAHIRRSACGSLPPI